MIIELIRAHVPEDVGLDRRCGICAEGFRSTVVLAQVLTDERMDLGEACPECVALMGCYKPEKVPTREEYEEACARWVGPIWNGIEEASASWENNPSSHEDTVKANTVSRA